MYKKLWKNYYQSVCSISLLGSTNSKIFGVTGFQVGENIITDDLLYNVKDAKKVKLTFYDSDGFTPCYSEYFDYDEFQGLLPGKRSFDQLGFTVFKFDPERKNSGSGFELCNGCGPAIGMEVATITHQFEYNNISLKPALVTSFYKNNRGLTFIQYDGTVKPGSTGGPLIDLESGKVIGVIATKELSVVKNYKELMIILDNNIESLKQVEGKWIVNEIDPIQVLIANQNMIKYVSREFFKNSSVRVGVALDVGHLAEHLEERDEVFQDQQNKENIS